MPENLENLLARMQKELKKIRKEQEQFKGILFATAGGARGVTIYGTIDEAARYRLLPPAVGIPEDIQTARDDIYRCVWGAALSELLAHPRDREQVHNYFDMFLLPLFLFQLTYETGESVYDKLRPRKLELPKEYWEAYGELEACKLGVYK
jgi:hypothetical protein